MSNKFLPHYLPDQQSYLEELPRMDKPEDHPSDFEENTRQSQYCWDEWNSYTDHIASLRRLPAPFLTPAHTSEMIEGVDFRIEYQVMPVSRQWNNVNKSTYDSWRESERRIIAIPVPPAEKGQKFYAVEYASFWNIQTVEGYEESDNILDAESVGQDNAEKYAKLIVELLNKHYGV